MIQISPSQQIVEGIRTLDATNNRLRSRDVNEAREE